MKFWSHVENHLVKRDCRIYYAGGTLCVNVPGHHPVCMNMDGLGFICNPNLKASHVYLPDNITHLVKKTYTEVKGVLEER